MTADDKLEIRAARESDIPELARLIAAIGAYHEAIDDRVRVDWDEVRDAPNWLRLILNRDHHAIWVADRGQGRLVGYLWMRLHRQRQGYRPKVVGYISNAFIEEAWRGAGLMKQMLERGFDWFRSKDITVVTLSVLHRNWIGSSAWYKLGFEDWNEERRIVLKPRSR
ncbi:MAG: GNAT family N-acetyltransferase [Candidatus Binataceae bacterium]